MAVPETGERRADYKAQLLARLHDPLQLRIFLVALLLLIGYFGVYTPLTAKIEENAGKLAHQQKLADLATSLEQLQASCNSFAKRIPAQTDSKEWLQYMHEGIRHLPIKLTKLDCLTPRRVGPYQAVVLSMSVEGTFFDLDRFLRWLESNPRLLRIDTITIGLAKEENRGPLSTSSPDRDELTMQLMVLGMGG